MKKEMLIREILSKEVSMTPTGFQANELTVEQFHQCYELFFHEIVKVGTADIREIHGYGEFNEQGQLQYKSCRDFLIGTFDDQEEGYWYQWRKMFDRKELDKDFFDTYYQKMIQEIPYCEGKRFLVYNNTFFVNMVTDGKTKVGFPDWSRAGIADWVLDVAIMDLNKPYLLIPELFVEYAKAHKLEMTDFKHRFLCMAYYKGLDTLRWHASINDTKSVQSIMKSMVSLEERFHKMGL